VPVLNLSFPVLQTAHILAANRAPEHHAPRGITVASAQKKIACGVRDSGLIKRENAMLATPRIQETANRAKAQQLETVIRKLSNSDDQRQATQRQIEQRRATLFRQIDDPLVARVRLERIMQGNELTDIGYLAQGVFAARSVCRIVIRSSQRLLGYGTGFLVAPGVLLTNHHVFSAVELVRDSIAQFRYERDLHGGELAPAEFALRIVPEPIISKELDFALMAVESRSFVGEALDQYGWLRLNPQPGKAFIGEYLTIIQHPNGERKQICVRENKVLKYSENGPYLWYQTDTVAGSSGSPAFNNSWEVVALHHSAVPKTKRVNGRDIWLAKNGQPWKAEMGEDQVDWIANEGIRISRIVQYLASQHRNHPLTEAVLTASEPRLDELVFGKGDGIGEIQVRSDNNGNTRIHLPIEIGVKVGVNGHSGQSAGEQTTSLLNAVLTKVQLIEKVVIDQDNYDERNGYDPKFLGSGLSVSLPKLKSHKFGRPLLLKGSNAEIKYWNYSVVMNRTRRLAYFSAANIDSDRFAGNRDADGDTWYLDSRVSKIDNDAQLGKDFYKKQKEFEADRTMNPFDQGHLTRRKDLQWGNNDKEAKRNGDDSYHYTNCSPQHWQFNQSNKASGIWFRLEEAATSTLSRGTRLCVMNGPIFDAPLCTLDSDGRLRLELTGRRVPDGTFGGVKIPKMFFKVIAYRRGGEMRAKAFVVTQEDLLSTIDRYYAVERARAVLSDLEVRLYQVRITTLEKVTDLDFGRLSRHEAPSGEESLNLAQGLPIEDESEIQF
jgi:endonuclease G, mitochondrial